MASLLGISGSLRKASLNSALLRSAAELLPDGTTLDVAPIDQIPLYNGDLDVDGGPESVQVLKGQVDAADGLVVATPEYNYGVPGVLKNTIDWVSRPAFNSVLARKPVCIVSVSPGTSGGVRAQAQLKQVLLGTLAEVFPYRDVVVAGARERFRDGVLVDDGTRAQIEKALAAFVDWIERR